MENKQKEELNPSMIMRTGMGFWPAKVLLAAVHFELFTHLANGEMNGEEIRVKLGLHERSLYDFLDTLVALGFLQRKGLKENAVYSNAADTGQFLDKNKPTYIGGILTMANNRLYKYWGRLEEALKTGEPQNEIREKGKHLFEALYEDPERLEEFLNAMTGAQMGNFVAFARMFDFSGYNTLCDMGGASAALSTQVAAHNPHMKCISFDLPAVTPIARRNIEKMGLQDRVEIRAGDFFEADFPNADVITMGNILHDWGTEEKKTLMRKAYEALPEGGSLVVIENIIDDDRRENAFGLMMSLNMLIETTEGFDFTATDFRKWAKEIGYSEVRIKPLAGSTSAAIAVK